MGSLSTKPYGGELLFTLKKRHHLWMAYSRSTLIHKKSYSLVSIHRGLRRNAWVERPIKNNNIIHLVKMKKWSMSNRRNIVDKKSFRHCATGRNMLKRIGYVYPDWRRKKKCLTIHLWRWLRPSRNSWKISRGKTAENENKSKSEHQKLSMNNCTSSRNSLGKKRTRTLGQMKCEQ